MVRALSPPIKYVLYSNYKIMDTTNYVHDLYILYRWIRARCERKSNISYKNYWWRWIKCLWRKFDDFKKDMYDSYVEHIKKFWKGQTSIDRIDNDWNYCKENCEWKTKKEQARNKRNIIFTIIDGKKYTSRDISDLCWICIDWAWDRINNYNKWKLSKEWLFYKWLMPKYSKYNCKLSVEIDWIIYNTYDISGMCWISKDTAARRINDYKKWIRSKDALFKIWANHKKLSSLTSK